MTEPWLVPGIPVVATAAVIGRATIASIRQRALRRARALTRSAALLEVPPRDLGPLLGVDADVVAVWVALGVPRARWNDVRRFECSVRTLRRVLSARTTRQLIALRRSGRDERLRQGRVGSVLVTSR